MNENLRELITWVLSHIWIPISIITFTFIAILIVDVLKKKK